jgi:phosphohistidine phosphatase
MKRLYLLRHAKSSWDDASLSDYDRPLNDRGTEAAPFMGRVIKERGLIPEMVLSSPANRARTTAKLAIDSGGIGLMILFDKRIYEASASSLLTVLSEIDRATGSVMIVGHNPGLEGLIRLLTGEIAAMPTAALAVIDLDIDNWSDIGQGSAKLIEVLRPKEVGYLT